MSGSQRLLLVVIAVVIAVGAVVLIGSGGDDEDKASTTAAPQASTQSGGGEATDEETAAPAEPEGPQVQRVQVKGGQPVGGAKKIEVTKGDAVRIVVTSDSAQEVHLHGYDIEREVAPGKPGRFSFKANAEGIFEMELHSTEAKIASLVVNPS